MRILYYKNKKRGDVMEFNEDEAAKIHNSQNLGLLEFLGDENGDMTPPKGRNREVIKNKSVVYTTDKSGDYGETN